MALEFDPLTDLGLKGIKLESYAQMMRPVLGLTGQAVFLCLR